MCLLHAGLVNTSHLSAFPCRFPCLFHPVSKVLLPLFQVWMTCGCRVSWVGPGFLLHSLRGWLAGRSRVEWRADISAQGTWDLVLHMRPCWKGRGASEVTQLPTLLLCSFTLQSQFLAYTSKTHIRDVNVIVLLELQLECLHSVLHLPSAILFVCPKFIPTNGTENSVHGVYKYLPTIPRCSTTVPFYIGSSDFSHSRAVAVFVFSVHEAKRKSDTCRRLQCF